MTIRGYGPGKFDTIIDSYLYTASLDGLGEDCSDENGTWAGLMLGNLYKAVHTIALEENGTLTSEEAEFLRSHAGAVLVENSQGFVSVDWYELAEEAQEVFEEICADLSPPDDDDTY